MLDGKMSDQANQTLLPVRDLSGVQEPIPPEDNAVNSSLQIGSTSEADKTFPTDTEIIPNGDIHGTQTSTDILVSEHLLTVTEKEREQDKSYMARDVQEHNHGLQNMIPREVAGASDHRPIVNGDSSAFVAANGMESDANNETTRKKPMPMDFTSKRLSSAIKQHIDPNSDENGDTNAAVVKGRIEDLKKTAKTSMDVNDDTSSVTDKQTEEVVANNLVNEDNETRMLKTKLSTKPNGVSEVVNANEDEDTDNKESGGNIDSGGRIDDYSDDDDDNDNGDDDLFAGLDAVATLDLYSIGNYTFGKKDSECKSKAMGNLSDGAISNALRQDYARRGLRRSVQAVLLVHEHNFAHVLLLQRSDGKGEFYLPGGRLRPGENFEEGLLRKLSAKLCAVIGEDVKVPALEVGDKLGKWFAIDFTRRYFPYVPAHVTKVKEEVHVYSVSLPSNFVFTVPKNLQLVAVPLCDVYNNGAMYGSIISAVPALLSRFDINFC